MRADEFQKQQDENEEYEYLLKQDKAYDKWNQQVIEAGSKVTTNLTKEVAKKWI